METCENCGNEKNACTCTPADLPAENPAPPPAEPAAGATPPAAPVSADPFAGIGAAYTGEWPEPQPHFVEQVRQQAKTDADAATVAETGDFRFLRDVNGHYFNPAVCVSKIDPATGMPQKSVKGMWLLLRGKSRKDLSKKPPKEAAPADVLAGNLDAERAALEEARRLADANATATAQTCDMLAWIAIEAATGTGADAATSAAGIASLKAYFLTLKKPPTLPPWAVPLMIYGNAFRVRFAAEKAKPRRQALKEKAVLLWYRLTRKEKPKAPAGEGVKNG